MNQNICGNHCIKYKNKPLFFKSFTQCGLVKIRDLWHDEDGIWTSSQEIYNTLHCRRNWISEYRKIKCCIPQAWKNVLLSNEAMQNDDTKIVNTKSIEILSSSISVNSKLINYEKLKEKEIYFACLYPCNNPTSVSVWNQLLEKDFTAKDVFKMSSHYLYEKKVVTFTIKFCTMQHTLK